MNSIISRRAFFSTMALAPLVTGLELNGNKYRQDSGGKKPNILWIVAEDLNPFFGCYGYASNTPNVDRLAKKGVRFDNVFMPAPVCSPCRSALITGMMPTTIGVHNHHSSRKMETAIHLPENIKTLPELFKKAGYFTFNQGKDDYNFWYNREDLYTGEYTTHPLYGKSGKRNVGWKDRKPGQPFFGQIQLYGGKEIYSKQFKSRVKNPVDRKSLELPPYYPDIPEIREDWAKHMDSIQITDERVGTIIEHLKKDGELENTVIFFFSDHGMRLWRHKQFCYDSGLRAPLVVAFPGCPDRLGGAGTVRREIVSGLDISASSLALAGIPIPAHMESRDLFSREYQPREHVISVRDRCDYTIDRIRSVRTRRFRYIRNFFPDRGYMQPNYRDEWDITQLMRKLHADGKLVPVQDRFWSETRPSEELYELKSDPHEINNLAFDPEYKKILDSHRGILSRWICETGDRGRYPEDSGNLKHMLDVWRSRGVEPVNPEYHHLK